MKRILLLISAMVLAGCSDALGPGHSLTDLGVARQRWRTRGYDAYTYTIRTSCFCANVHPTRVIVSRDTVRSAVDLVTNQAIDPRWVMTIDQLFEFIQQGINKPAQMLEVSYDQRLGYPISINYDGAAGIADDELFIEVRDVGPAATTAR
jgi:hypothetical protein